MADNNANITSADAAPATSFHALQSTTLHPAPTAAPATVPVTGTHRGKCLYKTGKCENERALKTSGTAHNLCDEHRRRQNEHQRKLDSKNRFTRKDKKTSAQSLVAIDGNGLVPFAAVAAAADLAAQSFVVAPVDAAMRYADTTVKPATTDPAAQAATAASAALAVPPQPHSLLSQSQLQPHPPQQHQQPQQLQQPPVCVVQPPPVLQDFDGIMVPLPSYLEGHERTAFRARIYQKVIDFISDENIRHLNAKAAFANATVESEKRSADAAAGNNSDPRAVKKPRAAAAATDPTAAAAAVRTQHDRPVGK